MSEPNDRQKQSQQHQGNPSLGGRRPCRLGCRRWSPCQIERDRRGGKHCGGGKQVGGTRPPFTQQGPAQATRPDKPSSQGLPERSQDPLSRRSVTVSSTQQVQSETCSSQKKFSKRRGARNSTKALPSAPPAAMLR